MSTRLEGAPAQSRLRLVLAAGLEHRAAIEGAASKSKKPDAEHTSLKGTVQALRAIERMKRGGGPEPPVLDPRCLVCTDS